jgi:hypothetical protein
VKKPPPEGIDSVEGVEGVLYRVAETLPAEVGAVGTGHRPLLALGVEEM